MFIFTRFSTQERKLNFLVLRIKKVYIHLPCAIDRGGALILRVPKEKVRAKHYINIEKKCARWKCVKNYVRAPWKEYKNLRSQWVKIVATKNQSWWDVVFIKNVIFSVLSKETTVGYIPRNLNKKLAIQILFCKLFIETNWNPISMLLHPSSTTTTPPPPTFTPTTSLPNPLDVPDPNVSLPSCTYWFYNTDAHIVSTHILI